MTGILLVFYHKNHNKENNMTVSGKYIHLNLKTRYRLSTLFEEERCYRKLGDLLCVSHTTIKREIDRNGIYKDNKLCYDPVIAQLKYENRMAKKYVSKIAKKSTLETLIKNKLDATWSPETISGFLKKYIPQIYVSHETICQYIYKEKPEWIDLLPKRKGRKRRKRKNKYNNRAKSRIKNRIFKDERPVSVENRKTFGHYEVDTMVSKQSKEAILVIIERKTRKVKLRKLDRKSAAEVRDKLVKALGHFRSAVKTITYDNGTENAYHQEVNEILDCKSFFCNPYHSWEKGSVENVIGLVRRFIPKKTDLSKISDKELLEIERMINRRPRKILDFETPNAQFKKEWCTYS